MLGNTEQNRVEAESARVEAELKREHDLNTFFKRAAIGYLILAIGTTLGLYKVSEQNDNNLRKEINKYAIESCISSRDIMGKYNHLVDTHIQANEKAKILAVTQQRFAAADLFVQNVENLQKDKLHIPTIKECHKLILKL